MIWNSKNLLSIRIHLTDNYPHVSLEGNARRWSVTWSSGYIRVGILCHCFFFSTRKETAIINECKKLKNPSNHQKCIDAEVFEQTTICLFYAKEYEKWSDDWWVQCTSCHSWAHNQCVGFGSNNEKFVCDKCLQKSHTLPIVYLLARSCASS